MRAATDEMLLERLRKGEREAFRDLYDRYKGRLYAYCFRLLRNEQDAEDAVHDTFVKLHAGVDSLIHAGAFRMWLYRVARNESFMILRRSRGRSQVDPDDCWDDSTPLQTLVENDTADVVRRCLGMLKTEYRDVLLLREYENLSYAEIAEVSGATVDAVKARIYKARKALAERLKGQFGERERP